MNAPKPPFATGRAVARPDVASHADRESDLSDFPEALAQTALDRVLGSQTFRRSSRHKHFLTHVVRATLDGQHEQLKEMIIGLEVFGRPLHEYDPRRDPIVRVEAGRIREKLTRFYEGEGASEPLQIAIPVGSYAPRLIRRTISPVPRAEITPLAVLPFGNLSGLPEDAAFAVGLADQLIDTLGRRPNLRVVARFSSFKAHEKETDLKAIGRVLSVGHVVEGSIQRSGHRVRCIAHLSKAKTGVRVWSQRFERDTSVDDDLFAFQDTIADAVLAAVVLALAPDARARSAGAPIATRPVMTTNAKARDLFERARYHAQQGSIAGFETAIGLLEKAVEIDPDFAQAHSHLSAARGNLAPYVFAPSIPSFAKVKDAAMRALELDPHNGEALAMLGVIAHRIEGGWADAEPILQEALRVAPNSMLAHTAYAWGLLFNGRYAEAVALAERAIELDPLNIGQRAYNARLYAYAGMLDRSIDELHAVLALEPDHLFAQVALGIAYVTIGRLDLAMPCFQRVAEQRPDHPIAPLHVVAVLGLQGRVDEGRAMLQALLGRFRPDQYSLVNVAAARGCLGDRAGMLADLEKAAYIRDYLFVSVPLIVFFDAWREDAQFVSLLRRYGLDLLPRPAVPAG